MKKTLINQLFTLLFLFILMGCGSGTDSSVATTPVETSTTMPAETADESASPQQEKEQVSGPVDLCRCLTEPGNSQWAIDNSDACNAAISKELGVENWEKVNFSKEPELNKKWDALAKMCTGSSKVKTGVEGVDKNNELVPEIGTSYGYIWESLNNEAQVYTTLAFDGLVFRSTAYAMNGETDSENFTKIIDISGNWTAVDASSAEGVIKANGVKVGWSFSIDYTTLTNNKGVIFKRVKVK
jgi:hypothetical protein